MTDYHRGANPHLKSSTSLLEFFTITVSTISMEVFPGALVARLCLAAAAVLGASVTTVISSRITFDVSVHITHTVAHHTPAGQDRWSDHMGILMYHMA